MMPAIATRELSSAVGVAAFPLHTSPEDYSPLLDLVGDARLVLIGEATHGTREFYRERAQITKRLVKELDFNAVAVEADWPHAHHVNEFVKGGRDVRPGMDPLQGFRRFPVWMWRNSEVLDFVLWLKQHNDALEPGRARAGFYGLDLYSLFSSIEAVLAYLEKVDPPAAMRARSLYGCFGNFEADARRYGYEAGLGLSQSCEKEAVELLEGLRRKAEEYISRNGRVAEDGYFYAERNARLVKNAERYYRSMFQGRISTWNMRDSHMAETLSALIGHLEKQGETAKVVVWEHNSHIGDARATQFGEIGELNVGQLAREKYGRDAFLIGFSTHSGSVRAASDWGALDEVKTVNPALPDSYESIFHDAGLERFYLDLRDDNEVIRHLRERRLQRAIGVIYRPESERSSHYFHGSLPDQFDAMIHIDRTQAVDTLGPPSAEMSGQGPETYPFSV